MGSLVPKLKILNIRFYGSGQIPLVDAHHRIASLRGAAPDADARVFWSIVVPHVQSILHLPLRSKLAHVDGDVQNNMHGIQQLYTYMLL
jgi:hypothetical protein